MNDSTQGTLAVRAGDALGQPGFHSAAAFELLQRESRVFIGSSMVPAAFRQWNADRDGQVIENPEALPNCVIALNIAIRMRADPLMVMQNLYIIHGYPSWSTKFLIALFNTCGRFTTLRYWLSENRDACYAYCTELATGERIDGPMVSLVMAKAEGWTERKGSKWRTMPEIMLRNRAAAFLIRSTAPDLSLGLPTRDESDDMVIEAEAPPPAASITRVRDVLRQSMPYLTDVDEAPNSPVEPTPEPAPEPAPGPTPAPEPAPPPVAKGEPVIEPKDLPIKDAERVKDAERPKGAGVHPPRANSAGTAFDMLAYAHRIRNARDVDVLTLMRDEVSALPPSTGRDELIALIDAKSAPLIDEGINHVSP